MRYDVSQTRNEGESGRLKFGQPPACGTLEWVLATLQRMPGPHPADRKAIRERIQAKKMPRHRLDGRDLLRYHRMTRLTRDEATMPIARQQAAFIARLRQFTAENPQTQFSVPWVDAGTPRAFWSSRMTDLVAGWLSPQIAFTSTGDPDVRLAGR